MALGALSTELFYLSKRKDSFYFLRQGFFPSIVAYRFCTRLVDVEVLRKCVEQKLR